MILYNTTFKVDLNEIVNFRLFLDDFFKNLFQIFNPFFLKNFPDLEELPVATSIDITFPNIELIIINDLGISFSPFLNFTIFESPISLKLLTEKGNISVLTEMVLSLSSSYYNAQINKWEPILEKMAFLFNS